MELLRECLELLNESGRVDYAVKNFGAKLEDAMRDDSSARKFKDVKEFVQALADEADPTKNKELLVFLVRMYIANQFKFEDAARIKTDVGLFAKVKSKLDPEDRDLNKYRTLNDLYDKLEPFEGNAAAQKSNKELVRDTKSNVTKLIDSPNYKVLIPKDHAAACFYGANTKWCTAGENSEGTFNSYIDKGPLYIVITKDPKTGNDKKFQLHYESKQFMDERDQAVSAANITYLSQFPEHKQFLNMLIHKHFKPQIDAAKEDERLEAEAVAKKTKKAK